MAKMLPNRYNPLNTNYGEELVYKLLKDSENTNKWTVLHSLLQQKHIKRKFGEIDFLIISPGNGIFVLEVKSSNKISRKKGVWYYFNKNGQLDYKKNYGPFEQAHDSMNTLREYISGKLGQDSKKMNYGYGVVFPRMKYEVKGPDEEPYMIYDQVKMKNVSISKYIEILSKNFQIKSKSKIKIDNNYLNQIVNILRPDFECITTTESLIDEERTKTIKCTDQQLMIFDSFRLNEKLLINGGAGTGKTVIAIENARQNVFEKKSTLFTCYNKQLGLYLKKQFNKNDREFITVGNIHSIIHDILMEHRMTYDFENFENDVIIKFLELIEEKKLEYFDTLIVDEAQDLISDNFLLLFSLLLNGDDDGLKTKSWKMFGDFNFQAIYSKKNINNMFSRLNRTSGSTVPICQLDLNCRNTKEVALHALFLSGIKRKPYNISFARSHPVTVDYYNNDIQQLDLLKKRIKQFRKEKIPYNKVIILSPYKYENSIISKFKNFITVSLFDVEKNDSNLKYSTIQSFKGLEFEHVIIVDIDNITTKESMELFYTGATRSTFSLTLFINQSQQMLFYDHIKIITELYKDEL